MCEEPEFDGPASLPGEPTEALPGSEKKIRIMTERAARREQLFHPLDGLIRKPRTPRVTPRERNPWPVASVERPPEPLPLPPDAGALAPPIEVVVARPEPPALPL